MRILVLADTHVPVRSRRLSAVVREALTAADLILHAGDIVTRAVLEDLERQAPVIAVAGNNDDAGLARLLPSRAVVSAGPYRIGMVHGHGSRGTTFSRAAAAFSGEAVDCVVFGHSHQPLLRQELDVLYLNPGSPTDRRRQPRYSFAWLEAGETLQARLSKNTCRA